MELTWQFIDRYFVDVLDSEQSADCQEVQLFVDGSWKVYDEEKATTDGNDGAEPRNSLPHSPSENVRTRMQKTNIHRLRAAVTLVLNLILIFKLSGMFSALINQLRGQFE